MRKGIERVTLRRRAEHARRVAGRGRCRLRYGAAFQDAVLLHAALAP